MGKLRIVEVLVFITILAIVLYSIHPTVVQVKPDLKYTSKGTSFKVLYGTKIYNITVNGTLNSKDKIIVSFYLGCPVRVIQDGKVYPIIEYTVYNTIKEVHVKLKGQVKHVKHANKSLYVLPPEGDDEP